MAGLASAQNSGWDRWVAFTLVVLAVALFDFVCRKVLVRGHAARIVMRTKATWDDELFSSAVLSRLCNVVMPSCWGSFCRWFSMNSRKPGRSSHD